MNLAVWLIALMGLGSPAFALGIAPTIAHSLPDSLTAQDHAYLAQIDSSFSYAGQGQWAEAELALKRAIQLQPNHRLNVYLLNNLAGLQQIQGHIDEAILSYSAALEILPDEPTIRLNRARLYLLSAKYTAATTDYSLLVARHPAHEVYRYQRAMAYMLAGQYDQADIDLSAIIERNGESLKARIGYALLETMRGRYNEAERLYDYLISKLPHSTEVYEGRARLYLARGMRGYAERDILKAFELSGNTPSPTLYRLRAEVARSRGDETLAQRDEETARTLEMRFDPLRPSDSHSTHP